jgi:NADH-quinone oxidoreductase subunit L
MDEHTKEHLHESPPVVWVPLVLLAIPSVVVGYLYVEPALFGDLFGTSIVVHESRDVLAKVGNGFDGAYAFAVHGFQTPAFALAMAGVVAAFVLYIAAPNIPGMIAEKLSAVHRLLINKYDADEFNERFFATGVRNAGGVLWRIGDVKLIDGLAVNGSARAVGWFSSVVRHVQSGLLYHYAFAMIIGLMLLLSWVVFG